MLLYDLVTDWKWNGELPQNYGWYHLMWLAIMIIACVLTVYFFARKHDKKLDDKFIFTIGVILIVSEIYKQVFYTLDAGHYQWYAFPFQFCSVPMYFAFIAPLVKNEKIKDAIYKFLASFGLVAGLAVMLYPDSCFSTSYITILIHTMLWHSSMVVMGIYLIFSRGYGKNIKEIIPAFIIFGAIVTFALIVNLVAYEVYFGDPVKNIHDDTFFLLYISPYYETPFPILSDIKEVVEFPIFFILYLVVFLTGIAILWSAVIGIRKLFNLIEQKKNKVLES